MNLNKKISLLEKLTNKIIVLKEQEDFFKPRRLEGRAEKLVQNYIKNGSKGNLDLYKSNITSLPDNLTVEGNLELHYTLITRLPNNLTVEGTLFLRNTLITSLPDDLKVGGTLYLSNTPLSKDAELVKEYRKRFTIYI